MNDRYSALVQRLVDAVLTSPGDTDSYIRRAVEARAAALGGRPVETTGELPAVVESYVDKVARHAYKVTDDDLTMLRQAGYSADAIFEITVSTALGASMSRLERGLAIVRGGR